MKVLIIRFSSFGDIAQALGAVDEIVGAFPNAIIHWLVREDFAEIVRCHKQIQRVLCFNRKSGLYHLFQISRQIRRQRYTHIYDAHNNLRSHLLMFFLIDYRIIRRIRFLRKPKNRFKRWLLFHWRINLFPKPYRGAQSFVEPLHQWKIKAPLVSKPGRKMSWNQGPFQFSDEILQSTLRKISALASQLKNIDDLSQTVAIVPSAAWSMKCWPVRHWKALVRILPKTKFIILGGSDDRFCRVIAEQDSERITDLSGKLSLVESCAVLSKVALTIAADTGLMHAADFMGLNCLALIGPTAFGYPRADTTTVIETQLDCKPCTKDGRGGCQQSVYQRCLVELRPETIAKIVQQLLSGPEHRTLEHSENPY